MEGICRSWLTTTTVLDRKSTRLNSSHQIISYAVFCLKKKNHQRKHRHYKNDPDVSSVNYPYRVPLLISTSSPTPTPPLMSHRAHSSAPDPTPRLTTHT